jgi:hypothetical protein
MSGRTERASAVGARSLHLTTVVACTLIAMGCDAHTRVLGRVVTRDNIPIPGATITFEGWTPGRVIADANGGFSIGRVHGGSAHVTATAEGFRSVRQKVHSGNYTCTVLLAPTSQRKLTSRIERQKLKAAGGRPEEFQ